MAHTKQTPDRVYAPPPPSDIHNIGRRTKDDLHEWSIYRQNVTSTIADNLLNPTSADGQSGRSVISKLPYGDFQMHDSTVESVLLQGRKEDQLLGTGPGDVYLRFGLPRIDVGTAAPSAVGYQKSQSEMDVRRALMQHGVPRGPYAQNTSNAEFDGLTTGVNGERSRKFQSMSEGLNIQKPCSDASESREYAASDVGASARQPPVSTTALGAKHVFNMSEFQGSGYGAGAASYAEGLPGAGIGAGAVPSGPPSETSTYWHANKRHNHGHYFSNIELFAQHSNSNYLKYAKADDLTQAIAEHPHLVLQDVGFEIDRRTCFDAAMLRAPKYRRVLENISMELYGGESLAIMYTSESEVRTFLDLMAYQHNLSGRTEGSFIVNGLRMKPKQLGDRVAYVCKHSLYKHMTVRQHLRMLSGLTQPATSAFRTDSMISQLIQTLALAPFQDRLVCDLGRTEKQRVKVACQILLDTDIILLDDITVDMDLYDAAFLIDYLRDWALKLNRIVIMAINPPTFELLAMFHKSALLASGRLIYCGKSSKMIEYFETVNFPCPLFKNPCDYYVDLLTYDTLTPEAAQESGDRIKYLADTWSAKSANLPNLSPPGVPPPRIKRSNCFVVIWWLYYRFWILLINSPASYLSEIFCCTLFSVILGMIYYSIQLTQGGVNDRFGLCYAMLTLFLIPNWCQNIDRVWKERKIVYYDSSHRHYSKICFYIAKVAFDVPIACLAYACYIIPVYFMAELRDPSANQTNGIIFGIHIAVIMLYALSLRLLSWLMAYVFSKRFHAISALGILISFFALSSGVTIHTNDIWGPFQWTRYVSPTQWATQILTKLELLGTINMELHPAGLIPFSSVTRQSPDQPQAPIPSLPLQFKCANRRRSGIIVHAIACPISDGGDAVRFANMTLPDMDEDPLSVYYLGLSVIAGWGLLAFLLNCCCIHCNHKPVKKLHHAD